MLSIYADESLVVPSGVKVAIKARKVTVTGPRGTLTKQCKHIDMDIRLVKEGKKTVVKFVVWHGGRKHVACLRTVKSMIENMITGVTRGFQYKMRSVYAHFPINVIISDDKRSVEIRNFLGEKLARQVPMLAGVEVSESKAQKDQIIIEGNDIETVSQSAADIHTACLVKNKGEDLPLFHDSQISEKFVVFRVPFSHVSLTDAQQFLDGIYVEEKGHVQEVEA